MNDANQLYCFSCAGGNSSLFDSFASQAHHLDTVTIDYPGHGARCREARCGSIHEIAEDAYRQVSCLYSGGRYALLGYSMGSIVAVELLSLIIENKTLPLPDRVFLAAHEPRTQAFLSDRNPSEIDSLVKEKTVELGGVPERILENRVFWRTSLPVLRTDFMCISDYRFEELDLYTTVPATILYSAAESTKEKMLQWNRYFKGEINTYRFEGGHFFLYEHCSEIASIVESEFVGKVFHVAHGEGT